MKMMMVEQDECSVGMVASLFFFFSLLFPFGAWRYHYSKLFLASVDISLSITDSP